MQNAVNSEGREQHVVHPQKGEPRYEQIKLPPATRMDIKPLVLLPQRPCPA